MRRVEIIEKGNSYFVRYIDRKPGQRYNAGIFYKPDHSLEEVKAWVKNNSKLQLIEKAELGN